MLSNSLFMLLEWFIFFFASSHRLHPFISFSTALVINSKQLPNMRMFSTVFLFLCDGFCALLFTISVIVCFKLGQLLTLPVHNAILN